MLPLVERVVASKRLPDEGVTVPGEREHLELLRRFLASTWLVGRRDGRAEMRVRSQRFDEPEVDALPSHALDFLAQRQALAGKWARDLDAEVTKVLVNAMQTGADTRTTMNALRRVFPTFCQARLENIARTEATTAYNAGRLAAFQEDEEFVTGVQFHAILDSRTTTICQSRNGLILRLDDARLPANTPPLHYQCRSVLVPVDRIAWAKLEQGNKKAEAEFFGFLENGPKNLEDALRGWETAPEPLPGFGTTDGIAPKKVQPAPAAAPPPPPPPDFRTLVADRLKAGLPTEQDVRELGQLVFDEIGKRLDAAGVQLVGDTEKARAAVEVAWDEHQKALRDYLAQTHPVDRKRKQIELRAKRADLKRIRQAERQPAQDYSKAFAEKAREVLQEVRPFGSNLVDAKGNLAKPLEQFNLAEYDINAQGQKKSRRYRHDKSSLMLTEQIHEFYPSDWWTESRVGQPPILLKGTPSRAYYDHGIGRQPSSVVLPDPHSMRSKMIGPDYAGSVALHEWGHRMEYVVPRLHTRVTEFLERRTKGENPERLSELTGIGYDPREVANAVVLDGLLGRELER